MQYRQYGIGINSVIILPGSSKTQMLLIGRVILTNAFIILSIFLQIVIYVHWNIEWDIYTKSHCLIYFSVIDILWPRDT